MEPLTSAAPCLSNASRVVFACYIGHDWRDVVMYVNCAQWGLLMGRHGSVVPRSETIYFNPGRLPCHLTWVSEPLKANCLWV